MADRESPRVDLNIPVSVIVGHDREAEAVLLDLSKSGFRLRAAEPLFPGDVIRIASEGSTFRGIVRWGRGNEAGGIFLDRVDLSQFS